jgi:hypothetical protein
VETSKHAAERGVAARGNVIEGGKRKVEGERARPRPCRWCACEEVLGALRGELCPEEEAEKTRAEH